MSIIQEFKTFAIKGNVVDLAVGVMIGAAFGKITTSLVNDIMTPPLGLLFGDLKFDQYKLILREATEAHPTPVALNYGSFLEVLINFIIVAFALFFIIKGINRLRHLQENAPDAQKPAPPPEDTLLLREIRDALKHQPPRHDA